MYTESLWQRLRQLEREEHERHRLPGHMRRPGPLNHGDDPATWRRVDALRGALWRAGRVAAGGFAERLPGLDIYVMAGAIVTAGQGIALECACSALAGVGSPSNLPCGGQPTPRRLAAMLGLPSPVADLDRALPPVLACYERGAQIAWGRGGWGVEPDSLRGSFELSEGHVQLGLVMLRAWAAARRRGSDDMAGRNELLQACRRDLPLGAGVGEWLLAQEARLLAHPMLRPASQQIELASSRSSQQTEVPVTPAQLLRKMEMSGPGSTPAATARSQLALEDEPLQLDQDRQAETLRRAGQEAIPFCEECVRSPSEVQA
jgi:hypothetical protein